MRRGPDEIAARYPGQDVTSEGPRAEPPSDDGCESIVFFHTDTLAKSPHRHAGSRVFARTHTRALSQRAARRALSRGPPPVRTRARARARPSVRVSSCFSSTASPPPPALRPLPPPTPATTTTTTVTAAAAAVACSK